ncbi:MAG: hypothetical protein KDA20_00770 [Phycisphaerales bacterium]|nr:hypothetical protein [Phycisphaerales bacterium]
MEPLVLVATGSYAHSRLLPLGIAHDAITLTTLVLLIWSIRLNLARIREARRLRASQCPNCR